MLNFTDIHKSYKDRQGETHVFKGFNLSIPSNKFVSFIGPNGCGKTTLLNMIAGLVSPDEGSITLDNEPILGKKHGFVFQDYRNSLFPWKTAKDNIAFPLKIKGVSSTDIDVQVNAICSRFNCNFDLDSYPYQLSGGQQQFISLLRGLIVNPDIYLFDEPFSSLDYSTTLFMQEMISKIWLDTKLTTLFVSHNVDEAIFLSDMIVVLSKKPTSVNKIFDNTLPHPRTLDLIGSSEFAKLKSDILSVYTQESNL